MNTLTHGLAPVIFTSMAAKRSKWLGRREFIIIGVFGALPDLLNPHLTLEARMSSWSHGLPFWAGLSVCLIVAVPFGRGKWTFPFAITCSLAYLFHLFCDAISGGVNWAYPLGDWTWGEYWVNPLWWAPLDIACLLFCYFKFRALPGLAKWRAARSLKAAERGFRS